MKFKSVCFLLVICLISAALIISASTAQAETFDVTSCNTSDLIAAFTNASSSSSADTINLKADCTYTLTEVNATDSSYGPNGLPIQQIGGRLTVNGNGATIQRAPTASNFRILLSFAPATLNDLTIRNGSLLTDDPGDHGGAGVNITKSPYDAAPTFEVVLSNVTIADNKVTHTGETGMNGGGATINVGRNGELTVSDSMFSGNSGQYGAGLADVGNRSNTTEIVSTQFIGNVSGSNGGALSLSGYHTLLQDVRVEDNTGSVITVFLANSNPYRVQPDGGTFTIRNLSMARNSGTLLILTRESYLYNSTIADNEGVGIYSWGGIHHIESSTIVGNGNTALTPCSAYGLCEGTLFPDRPVPTTFVLKNSIVANNGLTSAPNPPQTSGVAPSSSHSLISNGTGSGLINGVNGNLIGSSSQSIDPQLVKATDPDTGIPYYGLLKSSPAWDAGSNTLLNAITVGGDQRGSLRIQGNRVDMGAIEWPYAPGDKPGIFNPGNAAWLLRYTLSNGLPDFSFLFGPVNAADGVPLTGDWDGDGLTTQGVYIKSSSVFALSNVLNGAPFISFPYGEPGQGYIPVTGDWNGDGVDSIGLHNPANGVWLLTDQNTSVAPDYAFYYGNGVQNYLPLTGDWNGDGKDTVGIYVPQSSVFVLSNNFNGTNLTGFPYGTGGTELRPLVGDWNSDQIDTVGLWNPGNGAWLPINTNASTPPENPFVYGSGLVEPIVGAWVRSPNEPTPTVMFNNTPTVLPVTPTYTPTPTLTDIPSCQTCGGIAPTFSP